LNERLLTPVLRFKTSQLLITPQSTQRYSFTGVYSTRVQVHYTYTPTLYIRRGLSFAVFGVWQCEGLEA